MRPTAAAVMTTKGIQTMEVWRAVFVGHHKSEYHQESIMRTPEIASPIRESKQ
jgi:hypothetical protein